MSPPTSPRREAFEAWLKTQRSGRGYSTTRETTTPDEYAFAATELAWKAWQHLYSSLTNWNSPM